MTNTGVEVMLNATLVESNDFKWNAGMTFTRNRNVVKKLADGVDVISLPWGFFGANQRLVAGEAYGTLYGDDWARDEDGNALVDASGYPVYSSTEVVVAGADVSGELSSKGMSFELISSTSPDFGTAHEESTKHSAANRKVVARLTMISLRSLQT